MQTAQTVNGERRFISLRAKLAGAMTALVACVAVFLFFFYPSRMESSVQRWAEKRAVSIGLLLASAVSVGVEFNESQGVGEMLGNLAAADDALYGAVFRDDGTILAAYNPGRVPPKLDLSHQGKHRTAREGNELHVVVPIQGEFSTGTLALGFSIEVVEEEKRTNRLVALLVSSIVLALGLGLAVWVGTFLVRPITALTRVAGQIVEHGDLTLPLGIDSNDEVGLLARSFRQLVQRLHTVISAQNQLVEGLTRAIGQLSEVGSDVSMGAKEIRSLVSAASGSMDAMQTCIGQVSDSMEVLQSSAEDGSSTIFEMATSNEEVVSRVDGMASTVKQTSTAIEQMATSVHGIAKNIEDLNATIAETSASMTEIGSSIRGVESSANKTAVLSDAVSVNAEGGVEAIGKTLAGIARIRESAGTASDVIERLEENVSKIGSVVDVINEVAHKTNLLALNAAIIAAQAGEQGRGFGVVADEIKTLADRTSTSTTEIAALIHAVQEESRHAVDAMGHGVESVEEGVRIGNDAAQALEKIRSSSCEALMMMKSIARATVEQVRGTNEVASSLQRIAGTVESISMSSARQSRGSEEIMASTQTMRNFTVQVQNSSKEQTRASRQVIGAIKSVSGTVVQVSEAQAQQNHAAENVLHSVSSIRQVAERQSSSILQLESAIESLTRQADNLRAEMKRFRV